MDPVRVKSNLDSVACTSSCTRRNSCSKRNACAVQIQISFSTHHFSYFNVSLYNACCSLCKECRLVMDALRSDTENDLLIDQRIQELIVADLACRNVDSILDALFASCAFLTELNTVLVTVLAKNSVDEVHLR